QPLSRVPGLEFMAEESASSGEARIVRKNPHATTAASSRHGQRRFRSMTVQIRGSASHSRVVWPRREATTILGTRDSASLDPPGAPRLPPDLGHRGCKAPYLDESAHSHLKSHPILHQ